MDQAITSKKSNKIKYIAVILMIILHLFLYPAKDYISLFSINGTTIEHLFTEFCGICVGIFVFLSGYGLVKKYGDQVTYKEIGKKILKFYINYWYIFLIFISIGLLIGVVKFDFKRLLLNFFGIISDYNYEWWFVILYVQLLLIFPLLNKIIEKAKTTKQILSIYIVSLIISIIGKTISKIMMEMNTSTNILVPLLSYQFIYVTGMIVARRGVFNSIQEKINLKSKTIRIVIIFFTIIIMNVIGLIPVIGEVVNPILIPIFIYLLNDVMDEPKNVVVYKTSTNIWLTHTFFIKYYFPDVIWWPQYSILIVIWTIILTTIVSLILDKGLEKIYKLLKI